MWRILKMEGFNNRIFGLDLLRFLAIFMVLLGHSLAFAPAELKKVVHPVMLDGVAIFFVLSGYLIGGILIRILNKENAITFVNLLDFWKRRWMRTLPAYLVVLIFLLIYTAAMYPDKIPPEWYKFFFFTQNLFTQRPGFFAEAWSLSIEEWFYLSVPLLLFTILYLFKTSVKWTILCCSLLIIGLVTWYRSYLYNAYSFSGNVADLQDYKDYLHLSIEYQIVPRLDAIMFGVLGAFFAHYYHDFWKSNFKYVLLALGVFFLYALKFRLGKSYGEFAVVWMPGWRSLGVLLMLPALSTLKNGLGKWTSWITFFSLISYSMYLVNLNLVSRIIIKQWVNGFYGGKMPTNDLWSVNYILFWILTIIISFLLYQCVEVPFMKLRDRKKQHT